MAAAEEVMRERGYAGAGIKEIVARGDAPIGSLYHHFPGGKAELANEALRMHAGRTRDLLVTVLSGSEPIEKRIRRLFTRAAEGFEDMGGTKSCAVGNVALDVGTEEPEVREGCRKAFDSWTEAVAPLLPWDDEEKSQSFAELIVIALEGAFVVARAEGDGGAFRTAGGWLALAARCASDDG